MLSVNYFSFSTFSNTSKFLKQTVTCLIPVLTHLSIDNYYPTDLGLPDCTIATYFARIGLTNFRRNRPNKFSQLAVRMVAGDQHDAQFFYTIRLF